MVVWGKWILGVRLEEGEFGEEVLLEVFRVVLVEKKIRIEMRFSGEVINLDFKKVN